MDMGPFAVFIWSSYGISVVVLAALIIRALRQPKP